MTTRDHDPGRQPGEESGDPPGSSAAPDESLDELPELGPEAQVDESLDELAELGVEAQVDDSLDDIPELGIEAQVDDIPELGIEAQVEEPLDDSPAIGSEAGVGPAGGNAEQASEGAELDAASYRQLYELQLRHLPKDVRTERAHCATGELLCALCLDAEPAVVIAVLQNPEVSLVHARLIADHHRNPVGLEALGRRADWLRDQGVRRLLMRNIQASEPLLRKALSPMGLPQVFRSNMGHENSERARKVAREVLREKFQRTSAEERVALVLRTEGRCLGLLTGVTLDQKTTALLCSRTYQSTLLVQSLARFPAAPPTLVAALLKQPLVQRSPHLKKLLLQHKNCPSGLKR